MTKTANISADAVHHRQLTFPMAVVPNADEADPQVRMLHLALLTSCWTTTGIAPELFKTPWTGTKCG